MNKPYIITIIFFLTSCFLQAQESPQDITYTVAPGGTYGSSTDADFVVAINPQIAFPNLPSAGEFTAIMYIPTLLVTGSENFTIVDDATTGGNMIYQSPAFAYSDGNTYFSFVYSGSGIDLSTFAAGSFQTIFSVDVDGGNPAANWQIADASTGLFADFGIRSELNVLGFNELVEMATNASLPVEFLDFRAQIVSGQTLLSWETANEVGNELFVVERSSNGARFEAIAELAGAGDSDEVLYYETWDKQPLSGTNYYRIKQVDFDGSFDYSPIRRVEFYKEQASFLVYPNPTYNYATIEFPADAENVQLQVIDATGRVMLDRVIGDGGSTQQLDVQAWQPGIYHLQLQVGGQILTRKLLVTDN